MRPALDEIIYGNPSKEYIQTLNTKSDFLDAIMPKVLDTYFPPNSSVHVQDELREILDYQKQYEKLSPQKISRYNWYGRDIKKYYQNLCAANFDLPEDFYLNEAIDNIYNACYTVSIIAKFKFQRPRPNQLAYAYKQAIFPIKVSSTPSFPCGQVLFASAIEHTLGNKFPQTYDLLSRITTEIGEKCLSYAENYSSDIDYAVEVSKIITTQKEWTTLYGI